MLVETSEVSVNPPPAVMSVPNGAPHEPAIYRTSQHDDLPDVRPSGSQAVIKVIVGVAARARLHIQPITSEERSRRSEYVRAAAPPQPRPKRNFGGSSFKRAAPSCNRTQLLRLMGAISVKSGTDRSASNASDHEEVLLV